MLFRFHTGSIKRIPTNLRILRPSRQFRFHTGSIKRKPLPNLKPLPNRFDSILVRLKVPRRYHRRLLDRGSGFDSILVRLKASLPSAIFAGQFSFDSILVRLKERAVSVIFSKIMFRFHTGSIKSLNVGVVCVYVCVVSIPYWFD